MHWLSDPHIWISLLTLTILEIVLGIDNIIFISILAGKLPTVKQRKARTVGLLLALVTRVMLLFSIFWLTKLTDELFSVFEHSISGKDLVMIAGGLGPYAGRVFRIGHLGFVCDRDILTAVAAIEATLQDLGLGTVATGAGVAAAAKELAAG